MTRYRIKRTYKTLTPQERAEHEKLLAKLDAERPEIVTWAREGFARDVKLRRVVATLKAARLRKGLSLSQVDKKSGIGKANLSRLENQPHANPTLDTLLRYASAIGVELRIGVLAKGSRSGKATHAA